MKRIIQFGFKNESPEAMNWSPVIDCRGMSNPYKRGQSDEHLKNQVKKAPQFMRYVKEVVEALREHDTVYVGCAYGKHRSGAVAEEAASRTGAVITNSRGEEL